MLFVVAPFAYLKDSYDCYKFIVDTEDEKIIKNIFRMSLNGKSRQNKAIELKKNHILTAAKYMKNFCKSKNLNVGTEWIMVTDHHKALLMKIYLIKAKIFLIIEILE